jgi:hypothetical protein
MMLDPGKRGKQVAGRPSDAAIGVLLWFVVIVLIIAVVVAYV